MTANHLLLYRIAELMLSEQQHQLPVDLLFEDEQIGEFVKSIQIDSPYQQILLEGVLTETVKEEKLCVTYTVEGYFHYVLGEVIFNQALGKEPEFLKDIIENNKLNGAQEGVEQCLIRDVENDDLSRLMWLIDQGGESMHLSVFPLVHGFTRIEPDRILALLFQNPTRNDYQVLNYVMDDLSDYYKHDANKALARIILNKFSDKDLSIDSASLLSKSVLVLFPEKTANHELILSQLISITKNKKSKQFEYKIGRTLALIKEYPLAIPILKKVVNERSYALNLIGLSYHYLKKYKYAIRYFEKYQLKCKNENAEILYNLATSYFALGNKEKAIKLTERVIFLEERSLGSYDSSFATTLIGYGQMLNKTNAFEKAQSILLKALKIVDNTMSHNNPQRFEVLFSLGASFMYSKKIDEAIVYFEQSLEVIDKIETELNRNPLYYLMFLYQDKGWALENEENENEAIYFYIKSIKIGEKLNLIENVLALTRLGRLYEEKNEYTKAIPLLEKAKLAETFSVEDFEWNPSFWLGESYYQLGLKQLEKKNRAFKKSFSLAFSYLKPWMKKIKDPDWKRYVSETLDYMKYYLDK